MKQTKRILHLILSGALFAGLLIWLCLSQGADIFSGLLMTCLVYTAIHMAIKGIFSLAGVEVFNNVFAGALDEPRKGGFMSFATLNIRYNPATDSMQLYDMYSVSMELQK